MTIYLDCSPLTSSKISGIGIYNKNLFLGLKAILGDEVKPVLKWNRWKKKNIVHQHLSNDVDFLPPALLSKKILYHGTDHKINTISAGPKIVTIHDMQPFEDKWLDSDFAAKRRLIISKTLNSDLQRIIAVSHFTKNEILKLFPTLEEKIDVIYHGCDFHNSLSIALENRLINIIKDRPFLLFLGNIEERKNLINQIKAFEILKKSNKDLIFILAGSPGFKYEDVENYILASKHKDSIFLTGYLNETEKLYALKNTSCLMFASWYEGFGIPVIEALSLNGRVLISHSTSLVEIAGEYCHQCNPASIEDIASKAEQVISSGNLKIIDLELWKNKWSWSKCAIETINSYKKIQI